MTGSSYRKGKTYEELYGKEKAESIKKKLKEREAYWVKGKKLSKEHRRKIGLGNKGKIILTKVRKRTSKTLKKYWKDNTKRIEMSNKIKVFCKNPEVKKRKRREMKTRWQNPEYKKKQSKMMKNEWKLHKEERLKIFLKSLRKRPTRFEDKIIKLCKEDNMPFRYVGDGQVILSGLNPDFIETNGKKLVIETYYSYWKLKNYGSVEKYKEQREEILSKLGYKILFLDENDLDCRGWEEKCRTKINNFEEEYNV